MFHPIFSVLMQAKEQKNKSVNHKGDPTKTRREDHIRTLEKGLLENKSGRWS